MLRSALLTGGSFVKYFKHKETLPAIGDICMPLSVHLPGNRREVYNIMYSGNSSNPDNI